MINSIFFDEVMDEARALNHDEAVEWLAEGGMNPLDLLVTLYSRGL